MKPILLISFSDGSYNPVQNAKAKLAAEALQESPFWKKQYTLEVNGPAIYEKGMTQLAHAISHAFLYGWWAADRAK